MNSKYMVLGREATQAEQEAIDEANEILAEHDLELIGTRPKDR